MEFSIIPRMSTTGTRQAFKELFGGLYNANQKIQNYLIIIKPLMCDI